jgi:hypothetical protein
VNSIVVAFLSLIFRDLSNIGFAIDVNSLETLENIAYSLALTMFFRSLEWGPRPKLKYRGNVEMRTN